MPKGVPLKHSVRLLVMGLFDVYGREPALISRKVFELTGEAIQWKQMNKMLALLQLGNRHDIDQYFRERTCVNEAQHGEILTRGDCELLENLRILHPEKDNKRLHRLFILSKFGTMSQENLRYVSESTIKNKLSELSYTLKVFGIENIGKNPQAQLKFLQIVESFTKDQFVSIDGMVVSRQDYRPKKGYALKGQRVKMRQYCIRDRTFAVM